MATRVDRTSSKSKHARHTPDEPSTGDGSASKATADREQVKETVIGELKRLFDQVREVGEYFSYFVMAKTDGMKRSLRHLALLTALTALGLLAVGGLIIIGSWLVLGGMAGGLGELFGGRTWLGSLATGMLLLAGLGLGIYFIAVKGKKVARERTARKYEKRQAEQQAEFGRNVGERAASAAARKK